MGPFTSPGAHEQPTRPGLAPSALTPRIPLFTASILSSAVSSLPCDPRLTFHSLRRGGAATLVALGISPKALKYWGRWSSDATTSL